MRLITELFWEPNFVKIFIDEILIFSKTPVDHLEHITEVLGIFQRFNATLSIKKSVFGIEEVEYLGIKISASGMSPLPSDKLDIEKLTPANTMKKYKDC